MRKRTLMIADSVSEGICFTSVGRAAPPVALCRDRLRPAVTRGLIGQLHAGGCAA
jgi:hypothetical protein